MLKVPLSTVLVGLLLCDPLDVSLVAPQELYPWEFSISYPPCFVSAKTGFENVKAVGGRGGEVNLHILPHERSFTIAAYIDTT